MKIFISYARVNRRQVETLEKLLTDLGHDAWFDREIVAGEDWWKSITSSIERCEVFVFALSPQSTNSTACRAEFQYALDLNKPILPVMLLEAELPIGKLRETQFVNGRALKSPETIIELSKALSAIKDRLLAGEFPTPDPLPPRPAFPFPPDPLAEIREKLGHINALTEQDLLEMVYQLSATARVGAKTEREALTILREIARHPRSTLRVAQVAKEAIQLRSGRRNIAAFIGVTLVVVAVIAVAAMLIMTNAVQGVADRGRIGTETAVASARTVVAGTQAAMNAEVDRLNNATMTLDRRIQNLEGSLTVAASVTVAAFGATSTTANQPMDTPVPSQTPTAILEPTATVTPELTETPTPLPPLIAPDTVNAFIQLAVYRYGTSLRTLAFSPDNQTIALGANGGELMTWDVNDKAIQDSIRLQSCPNILSLDYAPDGMSIAVACERGRILIWNPETDSIVYDLSLADVPNPPSPNVIRFDSTGGTLAVGREDGTILLIDLVTAETSEIGLAEGGIWGIDFGAARYLASVGSDSVVRLVDWRNGITVDSKQDPDEVRVFDVEFSPDGSGIAWSNARSNIYWWDLETGVVTLLPREHIDWIFDIDFTPDGSVLVSVSNYGQVILWNTQTQEALRTIDYRALFNIEPANAVIEEVAISPDGTLFATAGRDGVLRLWGGPR